MDGMIIFEELEDSTDRILVESSEGGPAMIRVCLSFSRSHPLSHLTKFGA